MEGRKTALHQNNNKKGRGDKTQERRKQDCMVTKKEKMQILENKKIESRMMEKDNKTRKQRTKIKYETQKRRDKLHCKK